MYQLRIDKRVLKDIKKFPPKVFKQVVMKMLGLVKDPRPQDSESLKGCPGGFRVDQGEYRILYTVDKKAKLVTVYKVRHRQDKGLYKDL